MERVIWDELDRPGLLGARLRAARALWVGPDNTPGKYQHPTAATIVAGRLPGVLGESAGRPGWRSAGALPGGP